MHRVVSRILEANDLGTLRGDPRPPVPPRSVLQSGFGSNGESEEAAPDLWDPDSTGRATASGFGKKEWNLIVVHDKKVVNAMAAPGVCLHCERVWALIIPGTVVVFTGILPVAKDEEGLAAILGHGMFYCLLATCDLTRLLIPLTEIGHVGEFLRIGRNDMFIRAPHFRSRPSYRRALFLFQDLYCHGVAGRPNRPSIWNRRVSHYVIDGPPPLAQAGIRRFVSLFPLLPC